MIRINEDLCKGCKDCGLCIAFCPKNVLEMSDKLAKKGVNPPEIINPEDCTLCKKCMMYCPDLAIMVRGE